MNPALFPVARLQLDGMAAINSDTNNDAIGLDEGLSSGERDLAHSDWSYSHHFRHSQPKGPRNGPNSHAQALFATKRELRS
jgi:hypothetical protein